MNRIDGKVTKLEKNFSRMKAAQNNNKSKYEDTWIKEAVEAAMDIRVLLHIEMRASGKPNAEIEKRIYNCFLKYGDTGGKSPAADTSKPKPATPDPKPSTGAGGAKAKICDAAKKTTKECEDAAAEEAREKKRREREERERAEEAAKEAARKKREAEQKRIEEEKRKQREAEEKREREEEERRKKEE